MHFISDGLRMDLVDTPIRVTNIQPGMTETNFSNVRFHELHKKMGCICYENPGMGIYFIADPDNYWLEILPTK